MNIILAKIITLLLPTKRSRHNFRKRHFTKNTVKTYDTKLFQFGIERNLLTKKAYRNNNHIDIIIPVFNGMKYLTSLFNSIIKNTDLPYNLIVIDDCSTDQNVINFLIQKQKMLGEKMTIITNKKNLGFLQSANIGLSASKHDCVLLNTDVELPSNWASRLFSSIFEFDEIASVTPFSNAATIFSFPEMNTDNVLNSPSDLGKIDAIFSKVDVNGLPILAFPTGVGFCMAMSRNAIEKVGLFDPIFGRGYGEENDWCQRACKLGFINTIAANLFVYHKHGGTFPSEEKAQLCRDHMSILQKRYPSYVDGVFASVQNNHYLNLRNECLISYNKLIKPQHSL